MKLCLCSLHISGHPSCIHNCCHTGHQQTPSTDSHLQWFKENTHKNTVFFEIKTPKKNGIPNICLDLWRLSSSRWFDFAPYSPPFVFHPTGTSASPQHHEKTQTLGRILLDLSWDFGWKRNGTLLFWCGLFPLVSAFACSGFAGIHSCGYRIRAFKWKMPQVRTCQKFSWMKNNIGKRGEFGVLGFSRGNEYLYEKQCCIYWRGRPTHSESSSSTLSMSSGFPYTAHCFVKVVRKVTQTTKTANEKDQPTEIATESALLRFFHQLTAQQMIDIDTAFHCQQKTVSLGRQMHQIITRNRVIVLRSSHLGITLVFSKKIDSDGHSPAHFFSKQRWGCSSWCFGVVWKREFSHLKMPNWIPTHQTSMLNHGHSPFWWNECFSHLARKASLGKIARKWWFAPLGRKSVKA